MKAQRSRFAIFSIALTLFLTVGIGGFSIYQAQQSDIGKLDNQIKTVVSNVEQHPEEAVSAALYAAESETLDLTISLLTNDGMETIIKQSHLSYLHAPDKRLLSQAEKKIITIGGENPYRLRVIKISQVDYIVIAASLEAVNSNVSSNIKTLLIFALVASSLAIFFSLALLRRHNRRLDADSLERMREFLADASHELRTPLTVIKGYNEMLGKNQIEEPVARERAFARVNSEILRMENLIHDLLLLAELGEQRPVEKEEVDLSDLLHGYVTDFRTLNSARTINSDIEEEIIIEAVRDHLARLIQNILTNIKRHTPQEAAVNILLNKKAKEVILIIEDGGPGLPDDAYKKEIKAMRRFDPSRSRETGGSGLGMSIIAAIVQEHRGKLTLRKSDLGGLAVEVHLPL